MDRASPFAVPLACELVQWAFPQMNRVGFQLSDLVANWSGVVVGVLLGLALSKASWMPVGWLKVADDESA